MTGPSKRALERAGYVWGGGLLRGVSERFLAYAFDAAAKEALLDAADELFERADSSKDEMKAMTYRAAGTILRARARGE